MLKTVVAMGAATTITNYHIIGPRDHRGVRAAGPLRAAHVEPAADWISARVVMIVTAIVLVILIIVVM